MLALRLLNFAVLIFFGAQVRGDDAIARLERAAADRVELAAKLAKATSSSTSSSSSSSTAPSSDAAAATAASATAAALAASTQLHALREQLHAGARQFQCDQQTVLALRLKLEQAHARIAALVSAAATTSKAEPTDQTDQAEDQTAKVVTSEAEAGEGSATGGAENDATLLDASFAMPDGMCHRAMGAVCLVIGIRVWSFRISCLWTLSFCVYLSAHADSINRCHALT